MADEQVGGENVSPTEPPPPAPPAPPKAQKRPPDVGALQDQVRDLSKKIDEFEKQLFEQRKIMSGQEELINTLAKDARSAIDPRVSILIGGIVDVAQDPFNTSAWDRMRGLLRAMAANYPDKHTAKNHARRSKA